MQQQRLEGWPADVARASLVWILYVAGGLITFAAAWGGMGYPGFVLFIVTVIFGPFAAAWIACRIVPADYPLIGSLGAGFFFGLIFFSILGFVVLKVVERQHVGGSHDYIPLVFIAVGPLLGALAFSRFKRRSSA